MRGSQDYQVRTIMETVRSISESKHTAKELARENGAGNFHELAKEIGCHSYSTYDDYRSYMKDLATYVRAEFGERDATRINSDQVNSWLRDKVDAGGRNGDGVSRQTFDVYAAAIEKFEVALNRYSDQASLGREYKFDLAAIREYAHEQTGAKNTMSRAYKDAEGLVREIERNEDKGSAHIARLIHETGLRIEGATIVKAAQLLGYGTNPITGAPCGIIHAYGKGGTARDTYPSVTTYNAQIKITAAQSLMDFSKKGATEKYAKTLQGALRTAVRNASVATGQKHEAIHGLRWSWAQRNHGLLQRPVEGYREKMSYSASLTFISNAMFHARSTITCHYLH